MTAQYAFSLAWLGIKAAVLVLVTLQAADIVVVAYQQF